MFRKAADKMRAHPITSTALVGGGSILGLVGALKSLSKPEQEEVIDAALIAQEDEGTDVLGLSSASLLSAAVVLGMMDEDADILNRVTTTPEMGGVEMDGDRYVDPMGLTGRRNAVRLGHQRIEAPAPANVIIRRR